MLLDQSKICHVVQSLRGKLFTKQSWLLTNPSEKSFGNIVGKGENAGYQHFLLIPQCVQPYQRQKSSF